MKNFQLWALALILLFSLSSTFSIATPLDTSTIQRVGLRPNGVTGSLIQSQNNKFQTFSPQSEFSTLSTGLDQRNAGPIAAVLASLFALIAGTSIVLALRRYKKCCFKPSQDSQAKPHSPPTFAVELAPL